jgi:hypothetical protein
LLAHGVPAGTTQAHCANRRANNIEQIVLLLPVFPGLKPQIAPLDNIFVRHSKQPVRPEKFVLQGAKGATHRSAPTFRLPFGVQFWLLMTGLQELRGFVFPASGVARCLPALFGCGAVARRVSGRMGSRIQVELDSGFANLLFRAAKILPAHIGPPGD